MRCDTRCERSFRSVRAAFCLGLAVLVALAALAADCAAQQSALDKSLDRWDERRQWLGQTFVDVVDATDKAFGDPRVEDREQIVRAKVGLKAKVREGMDTEWSVPANFRVPLPALERKFNVYIEAIASPDTSDVSDLNAVSDSGDSSISATVLARLSDTFDFGATLGVHGGPDIGPELFARYEKDWLPWKLFGEQRGYWRTDNGWGGRTMLNLDYRLPDNASFIRFANKADYYEELHDVDFKSGLIYRRLIPGDVAASAETGVEYNPYSGDPEESEPTGPNDDDDQAYVRLRMIGKVMRDWIELEVMPGYYYMWEHDDEQVWGIDVRLSIMYESFLRSPAE